MLAELPVGDIRALGQRPTGRLEEGERELPMPDGREDRLRRETGRLPFVEEGGPVDISFAVPVPPTLQSAQVRESADVLNLHARPARHLFT